MFRFSTDGIWMCAGHRLCCVLLTVLANQQYDRCNVVQDIQCFVKYRCKTSSLPPIEWLSQFAAAQPSVAKALEGILRSRFAPIFAKRKKIYAWHSLRPAIRSFSEGWWALRDSNPRHSRCKRDALAN